MAARIAIKIGAVPIIHPVLDAVVYFNPVTCIIRWNTAISARIKMKPWLLRFIEKSFLSKMAVINKNTEAIINLNEMIVSGDNSFNATLVAMNELPQKITARIINKYFNVREFKCK